ncbi:MAG: sulfotransferase family protein [Rhodobacteraceae bacterium]|nr:sulfotransferase family protein [Paracoccaceae bacterium]
MTCLLLKNPDAVLIHVPKCAGTSLRSFWKGRIEQRAFGHIPTEWHNLPSFAVVRDPEARFLSAVRMFKFGNPDYPGPYNAPVWPDLTVDIALAVLEDDKVPFDRSQRYLEANFKHHIIAQTHPYNCLNLAGTILRQENLAADFEPLRQSLGLADPVPHIRNTSKTAPDLRPTKAQQNRIQAKFIEDYRQLGYAPGGKAKGMVVLTPQPEPTIWQLWSGFFTDEKIAATRADKALPDEDVDLEPFASDLLRGKLGGTWPGRSKNLNEHFHKLLPEFIGQSRLAHLLACCIVAIRKTKGAGPGLALFRRITSNHTEQICSELNSRWLTSVCDTFADHGTSSAQRALGLAGSLLASTVKLAETERRNYYPNRPWPPNARVNESGPLYDGVIGFWTKQGDMVENLIARIEAQQNEDPVAAQFVMQLMYGLLQHDTVFRRMAEIAGKDAPPLVEKSVRIRLERITKNRL